MSQKKRPPPTENKSRPAIAPEVAPVTEPGQPAGPQADPQASLKASLTWHARLGRFALEHRGWLLAATLALAAGLRLWRLEARSIWYDESFSLTLAGRDLPALLAGTANDYHPPLGYLLLAGWTQLAGNNLPAGRLLSVVAGVAFVGAVYGLAREMFGARTALLAALLAAVAPFQILYSQETRHYSLQALLGALLTWTFYRAWRRNGRLDWACYGLVCVLALYNLYFSIFQVALLNLFFLAAVIYRRGPMARWPWPLLKNWLAANLAAGLLYAPWALVILQQAGQIKKSYWIQPPNPLEFFRLTNVFLFNATNLTTDPLPAFLGLLLASAITLFMFIALRYRLRRGQKGERRRSFEIGLLLSLWPGVAVLVLLISYLYAPIYLERSLLGISAAFYSLLGRVVQTARRPAFWLLLAGPGLVVLAWSLYSYYYSPQYTFHYDNRRVADIIRAEYRPGDITLHTNKLTALPLMYLQAPGPQFVAPEEPGNIHDDLSPVTLRTVGLAYTPVPAVLEKVWPGGRVWFVRMLPQPGQSQDYPLELQRQLESRLEAVRSWDFWGGRLFLFRAA